MVQLNSGVFKFMFKLLFWSNYILISDSFVKTVGFFGNFSFIKQSKGIFKFTFELYLSINLI